MDFYELITKRESCRSFDTEKTVDTDLLKKCARWACLAPSACNSQPWSFVIVNKKELLPAVARGVQDEGFNLFASEAPAFIIVYKEEAKLLSKFDGLINDSNSFRENDLGIAVAHLCLAATENGLSTCIMGWRNDRKINEALGLPEEKKVHCVIAVGYSKTEEPRKKVRKNSDDKITVIE